jgi:hypothetical protein
MAKNAKDRHGVSIRVACEAMGISETCYRYQPRLSDENAEIADWLIRLTHNWKDWGFGLCFLFLRNVKGFSWNHKRVYRIYKELELNLRIKPKIFGSDQRNSLNTQKNRLKFTPDYELNATFSGIKHRFKEKAMPRAH